MSITNVQWDDAVKHSRAVLLTYVERRLDLCCLNVLIIRAALKRYTKGERTKQLYDRLINVE